MTTSAFQRFCVHDGKPIPAERLIKSNLKALFCSDECRFADKNAQARERTRLRVLQGRCPTCKRKRGKTHGDGNTRVHEVLGVPVVYDENAPKTGIVLNADFLRNRFERIS